VCYSPDQIAQYHILGLYISNLHKNVLPLKICHSPPEEQHYHILVLQNLHILIWPFAECTVRMLGIFHGQCFLTDDK